MIRISCFRMPCGPRSGKDSPTDEKGRKKNVYNTESFAATPA